MATEDEIQETFSKWQPIIRTDAKEHPCSLYESSIMKSIKIDIPNNLHISHTSDDTDDYISSAQIEAISMCINCFDDPLSISNDSRGFFLGDSTGVGKTRTLSGIVSELFIKNPENFNIIWVTQNKVLIDNAKQEFEVIKALGNEFPNVVDKLTMETNGVFLTTYNNLEKIYEDLKNWINTPNSLIVFDEAHHLKTASSKMSQAALKLQEKNQLRVVYSTATAASKVREIHYMTKLGLWADSDHKTFCKNLERYGTQSVIFIALQLKYNSKLCSRNLGFEHVKIDVDETILNQEQIDFHDKVVERVKEERNFDGINFLNFFNNFITSFKIPTLIRLIEESLRIGESVIVGVNFTGEASIKKGYLSVCEEILKRNDVNISGLQFDINPIDYIIKYFGYENVAEISGRKHHYTIENGAIVKHKNITVKKDIDNFQKDIKKIAIITKAGSAGISLNGTRKRHHIILELPRSGDVLTQQFGRAYRANNNVVPHYTILKTNLPSEARFINSIQKKLENLGAISKGDKNTGVLSNTRLTDTTITSTAFRHFKLDFSIQQALNWMETYNSTVSDDYNLHNLIEGFDKLDHYLKNYAMTFFSELLTNMNWYVFYAERSNNIPVMRERVEETLRRYTNWNSSQWRYSWSSFSRRFDNRNNNHPRQKIVLLYRAIFKGIYKYLPMFREKLDKNPENWSVVSHKNFTTKVKNIATTLALCSIRPECSKTLGSLPVDLYGEVIDYLVPHNELLKKSTHQLVTELKYKHLILYKGVNEYLNSTLDMTFEYQKLFNNILNKNINNTKAIERNLNRIKTVDDFILKGKKDFYVETQKTHEDENEIDFHVKVKSKHSIDEYLNFYENLKDLGDFVSFVVNHKVSSCKIFLLAKKENKYYLYEAANFKPFRTFLEYHWISKEDEYIILKEQDVNWVKITRDTYEHNMKFTKISYHLKFTVNNAIRLWGKSLQVVLKINSNNSNDMIGLLLKNSREFH